MRVIPPVTITDAKLTSSTVPEVAPAIYSAATTYALNNEVSVAGAKGLRSVYKSLQASNLNHTPSSSPTFWQYLGDTYQSWSGATTYALGDIVIDPTTHGQYESLIASNLNQPLTLVTAWLFTGLDNRWAMFDLIRGTATVTPIQQTIVLTVGARTDSLAIVGLIATSVRITSVSSAVTVYDKTITLSRRVTNSWYTYFFSNFDKGDSVVVFDIPPISNSIITIQVTNTQGSVTVGGVVLGQSVFIGNEQYSSENDVLNFSTITRDFAGTPTLTQRRNVPKTNNQIMIDKALVDVARRVRDSLNATPAIWSGIDDNADGYFESLLILGIYKRFSINLAYPEHAMINLELEEI